MKTPHNRLTRFPRNLLLVVGIFAALVALFVYYVWSEKQLDRANDQRYNSMLLADELRQSSDDLTRMVRLYVETGEARYGQYYQDILDIRDGRKARPEKYHSIYWDLVLVEGRPPRPSSGQVIPLLELMRQAGFTGPEMQRLAEAKANSDALTAIELAAMKLVGPDDRHAGANHGKARMLVFGDSYHQAKAAIMKPIGEFYALLDQRTLDAVRSAEENAVIWRDVFIAFCLGVDSTCSGGSRPFSQSWQGGSVMPPLRLRSMPSPLPVWTARSLLSTGRLSIYGGCMDRKRPSAVQ